MPGQEVCLVLMPCLSEKSDSGGDGASSSGVCRKAVVWSSAFSRRLNSNKLSDVSYRMEKRWREGWREKSYTDLPSYGVRNFKWLSHLRCALPNSEPSSLRNVSQVWLLLISTFIAPLAEKSCRSELLTPPRQAQRGQALITEEGTTTPLRTGGKGQETSEFRLWMDQGDSRVDCHRQGEVVSAA